MNAKHVIRSNQPHPVPPYAVVELWDLGGKDIAWFFEKADAEEYIEFLNRKVNLRISKAERK